MLLICYKKCSTCRNVEKELEEKAIDYEYRNIDIDNPSKDELKKWYELSGLDIKKFFNTSGMKYRELNLKDKLKDMSLDEKLEILSTDGMLVKRPIIITDNNEIYVGKKARDYVNSL